MRALWPLLAALLAAAPAWAEPVSRSPRETGLVVLRDIAIRERKVAFRVDSGGCTDAASFRTDVTREQGSSAAVPNYRLAIRRTRIDDCKAMLWDGVLIELDLEKDLGLKGSYTISVENPVLAQGGSAP
jgi:hypothetical protein